MAKTRRPDVAKCASCKRILDLATIRERKDYTPGICPICGGALKAVYERTPHIRSANFTAILYALTNPKRKV